jgi:hypothetical protein
VSFIAEIPSLTANPCRHVQNDYALDTAVNHRLHHSTEGPANIMDIGTFHRSMLSIRRLLQDADTLTALPASEILLFMMSDLNRHYNP